MRSILERAVTILSAPWAHISPAPDSEVIEASRWLPGKHPSLPANAEPWWIFLHLTTLIWGLLPRAILWLIAYQAGKRALAGLDFQGRAHRALWRELTAMERIESDEKPLDGVLVLDVGGSGLAESALRPFLLRRLRVHPALWKPVAVLDAGAEREAAEALTKAPAGIVLLAEGWALSPPRMTDLHRRIRNNAGSDVPVKFLVANADSSGQPAAATAGERREWERFVDSLRDPAAEVHFFEVLQPTL